jgi:hypothetical protein
MKKPANRSNAQGLIDVRKHTGTVDGVMVDEIRNRPTHLPTLSGRTWPTGLVGRRVAGPVSG